MMTETYIDDIPADVARRAHEGTSFVPEKRAEQVRQEYALALATDRQALEQLADTDDKRQALSDEFARYRAGYRIRTLAYLHALGRCVSSMITGPANFPVAQNEKRNTTANKRLQELIDFRTRALDSIRRRLCPEQRPIMSGDADAVERLAEKIAEAEALQSRMKSVNAIIRKHWREGLDAARAALVAAGESPAMAVELTTLDPCHGTGFADYQLRNNNATIRRLKARLAAVSRNQAKPSTTSEANGIRLEDCPAENRVRLFFPGKPDSTLRGRLKTTGFRWTPSLGCWQAYRNPRSLSTAQSFVS